jgi:IS6 family transposase
VIVQAVRWYLRYPLAYEHVAELLAERGLGVDASCVWRWVQAYSPELNYRCRSHLKRTNKSYRVDETYIKVKGEDKYLYRAVDSTGQTIDFLLSAKRDAVAAKRFFQKVFSLSANPIPRVINVDKNPAYPAAVDALKADGILPRRVQLRQCKYLNNVVEQDHRTVKKRTWLAKGYGSFQSAWRTLEGIETMSTIRKGPVKCVAKADVVAEAQFIAALCDLQRSRIIRQVEAVGFLRWVRSLATLLVALSLVANGEDVKSWGNLDRISAGQAIEIRKITGGSVRGNYAAYSGQSIDLSVKSTASLHSPCSNLRHPAPSQNAKGYVDRLSGRSRSGSCCRCQNWLPV